jgi:nicotinamide riboside kinase
LKVLVNGAFSTGKTALVRGTADSINADRPMSASVTDEVARRSPFPLNLSQSFTATLWLLTSQISTEIACEKLQDVLVVDRGVPDIIAHYLDICERETCTDLLVDQMIPFLKSWCATYDVIITTMVDQDVGVESDGLRIVDHVYRNRMAELNRKSLEMLGVRSFVIPLEVQRDEVAALQFIRDAMSRKRS